MRAHILSLMFVLSFGSLVLGSCNEGIDFECLYDMFFGDDESEESSSAESNVIENLAEAVSNLSSIVQNHIIEHGPNDSPTSQKLELQFINNTEDKINQIPNIVSYLVNLTKALEDVKSGLSPSNSASVPSSVPSPVPSSVPSSKPAAVPSSAPSSIPAAVPAEASVSTTAQESEEKSKDAAENTPPVTPSE